VTKYERGLGMLGLARRASALTSGFSQVEASLRAGAGRLLLLDGEISPETEKQLVPLAEKHSIAYFRLRAGELSDSLGDFRMCALVTDEGFGRRIYELLNEE
jgi:ribosomal protein L7Ae-like RNA K-turn-binding protein